MKEHGTKTELRDATVAVDTSNWVYQLYQLPESRIASVITNRISRLLHFNIRAYFVIDGKPPSYKINKIKKRNEDRDTALLKRHLKMIFKAETCKICGLVYKDCEHSKVAVEEDIKPLRKAVWGTEYSSSEINPPGSEWDWRDWKSFDLLEGAGSLEAHEEGGFSQLQIQRLLDKKQYITKMTSGDQRILSDCKKVYFFKKDVEMPEERAAEIEFDIGQFLSPNSDLKCHSKTTAVYSTEISEIPNSESSSHIEKMPSFSNFIESHRNDSGSVSYYSEQKAFEEVKEDLAVETMQAAIEQESTTVSDLKEMSSSSGYESVDLPEQGSVELDEETSVEDEKDNEETSVEEEKYEEPLFDCAQVISRCYKSSEDGMYLVDFSETLNTIIEVIRSFDLPIVFSPSESDAQCGLMYRRGLISGVISEDSDMFLFGVETVYKGFFKGNVIKYTCPFSSYDRFSIAYLLGCDYKEKVRNVGVKTVLRRLPEVPSEEVASLRELFENVETVCAEEFRFTKINLGKIKKTIERLGVDESRVKELCFYLNSLRATGIWL